jgi:hypothetical protein
MERHVDAGGAAELAAPHAGGQHDVLRGDIALVGRDAGDPPFVLMNGGDLDVLEDAGAAHARTLGQRDRGIDRVGLAILRQKDAANHGFYIQ